MDQDYQRYFLYSSCVFSLRHVSPGLSAESEDLWRAFTEEPDLVLIQSNASNPELAIQVAMLNRLGNMLSLDVRRIRQVGNGTGHFQDAVVGPA